MRTAALAVLSLVMAAGGLSAQAQQMPAEYIGVWAHERGSCDLAVADAHGEFPFLVVTRDGYGSHESDCRLTALGRTVSAAREVTRPLAFTCSGEGETWAVTEQWTLQFAQRRLGGWDMRQAQLIRKGGVFRRCGIEVRPSTP